MRYKLQTALTEEKKMTNKKVWDFVELVARGNTEIVELERLASNLIEEKFETEQSAPRPVRYDCDFDYQIQTATKEKQL